MATTILKKERKQIKDAMWDNNPVTLQVLGICSALAVTVQLKTALVMCAALTFVVTMSNVAISVIRKRIPNEIRVIVQLSVIASLVMIADQFYLTGFIDQIQTSRWFTAISDNVTETVNFVDITFFNVQ